MKYRDPATGEFKTLAVAASDTLPIGAEIDFNGTTVPYGWEEITTSPIVESGSNENGDWVKWEDGTMICKGLWTIGNSTTGGNSVGSLWYNDINLWHNFPAPFIIKPDIILDVYDGRSDFTGSIWLQKKLNSVEATKFGQIRILSATNTTLNLMVTFIAIGKWK